MAWSKAPAWAGDAVTATGSGSSSGSGGGGGSGRGRPRVLMRLSDSRYDELFQPEQRERLRAGRLRAALDVYDEEPLPPGHPLRSLPNALLTPHRAGGTLES